MYGTVADTCVLCLYKHSVAVISRCYINKYIDYNIALAVDIIASKSLNVEIISELIVINDKRVRPQASAPVAPAQRPPRCASARDEPTHAESREPLTNCIIITQSPSRVERYD